MGSSKITNEEGWREFAAGGACIALHSGPSSPGRKGPKIVFHAKDVAAVRETLVARGARFGKVKTGGDILPLRRQGPGRQSHSIVQPLKLTLILGTRISVAILPVCREVPNISESVLYAAVRS